MDKSRKSSSLIYSSTSMSSLPPMITKTANLYPNSKTTTPEHVIRSMNHHDTNDESQSTSSSASRMFEADDWDLDGVTPADRQSQSRSQSQYHTNNNNTRRDSSSKLLDDTDDEMMFFTAIGKVDYRNDRSRALNEGTPTSSASADAKNVDPPRSTAKHDTYTEDASIRTMTGVMTGRSSFRENK
jgi:hypothetical protein